jgi:23S rRNA (cytosine1962-C5)-methyltransferase
MALIILHPGREKSLLRCHPWIFSGAIRTQKGFVQPGETAEIFSSDKRWLGRGAYSPESQIRVRIWSFDPTQEISSDFFRKQLERAIALRKNLEHEYNAYRLINAESDGLPGLIADRYGEFIVCQFLRADCGSLRRVYRMPVFVCGCRVLEKRNYRPSGGFTFSYRHL